jgi:hypothetical protein
VNSVKFTRYLRESYEALHRALREVLYREALRREALRREALQDARGRALQDG